MRNIPQPGCCFFGDSAALMFRIGVRKTSRRALAPRPRPPYSCRGPVHWPRPRAQNAFDHAAVPGRVPKTAPRGVLHDVPPRAHTAKNRTHLAGSASVRSVFVCRFARTTRAFFLALPKFGAAFPPGSTPPEPKHPQTTGKAARAAPPFGPDPRAPTAAVRRAAARPRAAASKSATRFGAAAGNCAAA